MNTGINAAFKMESMVARIIGAQEQSGVCFDTEKTIKQTEALEGYKADI